MEHLQSLGGLSIGKQFLSQPDTPPKISRIGGNVLAQIREIPCTLLSRGQAQIINESDARSGAVRRGPRLFYAGQDRRSFVLTAELLEGLAVNHEDGLGAGSQIQCPLQQRSGIASSIQRQVCLPEMDKIVIIPRIPVRQEPQVIDRIGGFSFFNVQHGARVAGLCQTGIERQRVVKGLLGLAAVVESLGHAQLVESHRVTGMPAHVSLKVGQRTLDLAVTCLHESAFAAGHLVAGLQFEIAAVGRRCVLVEFELRGNLCQKQQNLRTLRRHSCGLGQQRRRVYRPVPLQICLR